MAMSKFQYIDVDAFRASDSKEALVRVDVPEENCESKEEEEANLSKQKTNKLLTIMKWTLLAIFLASFIAGIAHAAVTPRPKACPSGQTFVRGQCIRVNSPVATTPQTRPPVPTPSQLQPLQLQPSPPQPSGAVAQCPLGHTLRQGKCSPKQCPTGMAVNSEGKCDCTRGFRKENNRCVSLSAPPPAPCNGTLTRKGNCIPPTPVRVKICPKDHQLRDGKCVSMAPERECPSGQRKNRKGACIPIVAGQSCGKDLWINEQGQCGSARPNNGCPPGKERNSLDNCVRIQICSPGQVKDATGVCQQACPSNQFMKDGKCVTVDVNNVGRG